MFTVEGVAGARNPAEATARYWLARASVGAPDDLRAFEAGLHDSEADARFPTAGILNMLNKLEHNQHPLAAQAAARLLVYRTLYIDGYAELGEERAQHWGVSHRTDYQPLGQIAEILEGCDPAAVASLPSKTETVAWPQAETRPAFAYAVIEGQPITVIHGDLAVAQAHFTQVRNLPEDQVVPLSSLVR